MIINKALYTKRIVNIWNSLSSHLSATNINSFRSHLNKFWHNQDIVPPVPGNPDMFLQYQYLTYVTLCLPFIYIFFTKMANVKQQLASLANSSGPSQKDRIEKYGVITANTVRMMSFILWRKISSCCVRSACLEKILKNLFWLKIETVELIL